MKSIWELNIYKKYYKYSIHTCGLNYKPYINITMLYPMSNSFLYIEFITGLKFNGFSLWSFNLNFKDQLFFIENFLESHRSLYVML